LRSISSYTIHSIVSKFHTLKLHIMIQVMPLSACRSMQRFRIYGQIQIFTFSFISPKPLTLETIEKHHLVGLVKFFNSLIYIKIVWPIFDDLLTQKLKLHQFLHSDAKARLMSGNLTLEHCIAA
jgi:hypothetical protein